jgi:hypothetical protein
MVTRNWRVQLSPGTHRANGSDPGAMVGVKEELAIGLDAELVPSSG